MEDAWEAARLCDLDEDIEAMPMGMHTVISEGASTFSGGQRQRMLIARAIVRPVEAESSPVTTLNRAILSRLDGAGAYRGFRAALR